MLLLLEHGRPKPKVSIATRKLAAIALSRNRQLGDKLPGCVTDCAEAIASDCDDDFCIDCGACCDLANVISSCSFSFDGTNGSVMKLIFDGTKNAVFETLSAILIANLKLMINR